MANGNGWLGSLISGLFGTAQQGSQMAFDASQAKKNREFQSEEAELNRIFQSDEAALQRDWSAAEAERARDWNEEVYEKYNSLSGKIAQAEQAGINPMLAVTGNAVSPMTANSSAPSGASAGSVGTPAGSSASMAFVDIIGKVLGFKQLQSEMDVNSALAAKYRAEAFGTEIDNLTRDELNQANIARLMADVRSSDASADEKRANISLITEKIKSEILNQSYIESSTGLNTEMAGKVYNEALKIFNEAESIAQDVAFKRDTFDDRKLQVEYDRLVSEFKARLKDLAMPEDDMHAVQEFFYKILAILK